MTVGKKNRGARTSGYTPAVLFEQLEQRILLSSDSLISAGPVVENIESAAVISSEVTLGITPAEALGQWQAAFPDDYYVVWEKDSPWDNLDQVTAPPVGVTELQSISLDIGRNEYESTSFVITNTVGGPISYTISSDASAIATTFRKGIWVIAQDGTEVNDALSLIDGNTVTIDPGESIEIWITVHGNNAAAGLYNPTITITPQYFDPWTVDLSVTVHDISLPEVLPLNISYWDYIVPAWQTPAMVDAKMADLKSHYVNIPTIHPSIVPRFEFDEKGQLITDYTLFDKGMDMHEAGLAPEKYVFLMLSAVYFEPINKPGYPGAKGRPKFLSPKWRAAFPIWLKGWVAHMKSRGMGYDKYYLSPYDERLDDSVYQLCKLIKETDPKIQVHTNALGSVAEINKIAPYVDVWTPLLAHWLPIGGVTGAMSQTVSLKPNTKYTFS